MQDIVRIGLLLDIYEMLLTKRQCKIIAFYINDNYSLTEISQKLKISRQGVHDIIKRTSIKLEMLEEKLGLYKKLIKNRKLALEIILSVKQNELDEIEKKLNLIVEG